MTKEEREEYGMTYKENLEPGKLVERGQFYFGDMDLHGAFHQLQYARYVLEMYFDEKPTPDQVINFAGVMAIKDIHSFLAHLQDDEVFSIEKTENFVNSKGEHKTIYRNIGLASILEKFRDQQL